MKIINPNRGGSMSNYYVFAMVKGAWYSIIIEASTGFRAAKEVIRHVGHRQEIGDIVEAGRWQGKKTKHGYIWTAI